MPSDQAAKFKTPMAPWRIREIPAFSELQKEIFAWLDRFVPSDRCRVLEVCSSLDTGVLSPGRFDIDSEDWTDLWHDSGRLASNGNGAAQANGTASQFDLAFTANLPESASTLELFDRIRTLSARSRGTVAVLVPNAQCYWYWITRIETSLSDGCALLPGAPISSLAAAFEAAGLSVLEESYFGRQSTAQLIASLPGIDEGLRRRLLAAHDSPLIPREQACLFYAAIATTQRVSALEQRVSESRIVEDSLRVMASNALAVRMSADAELARRSAEIDALRTQLAEVERILRNKSEEARSYVPMLDSLLTWKTGVSVGVKQYERRFERLLDEYRSQRAWRVMIAIRKAYDLWVRRGWTGKLSALSALLTGPFRQHGYEDQEIDFPALSHFLPAPPDLDGFGSLVANQLRARLPRRYDVVILAIIDFDFRFQRPQQLAAQFAKNGHRVFWVSPTRFVPEASPDPYHLRELRENIWEVHLSGRQPDIYMGALDDDNLGSFHESLGELYRDLAIAENAVLVQLPFWRKLGRLLQRDQAAVLAYDCMDEWDSFENMGEFNRTEERALVEECDVLLVTAARLAEKFKSRGLNPLLVRNAVDYGFFANTPRGRELSDVQHPIIGYFGAIADWIDLDLIYETAARRPQYTFVLIGQVFGRDVSKLESLPNVRLLGSQPYEQIPRFLLEFDACTIPFLLNEVTAATDPVKLYEYLSLGKPVVATRMKELEGYRDLIYLAGDAAEFCKALDRALEESDNNLRERRIEFAKQNTWACRTDVISEAVKTAFPLVSIVIVTHNSRRYIQPCLESILRNDTYPNREIIVVDNASTDGTVDILRAFENEGVRCEFLATNTGFAGGNNVGARLAQGECLVLLNADTMVTPGWLGRLIERLRSDHLIGVICPVTNAAGNEAKIGVSYGDEYSMERFSTVIARQRRGLTTEPKMVALFCAAIRRSLYWDLGGLDEGYGIGMFEDDDLSASVHRAGLRTLIAEDCFVHHFGQGAFSTLKSATYEALFQANRKRFEKKWGVRWEKHRLRPGVRAAFEEEKFEPETFCVR